MPAISSIGTNDRYETARKQKDVPKSKSYELIELQFIVVRRLQDPALNTAEGWHNLSLRLRMPTDALKKIDPTSALRFGLFGFRVKYVTNRIVSVDVNILCDEEHEWHGIFRQGPAKLSFLPYLLHTIFTKHAEEQKFGDVMIAMKQSSSQ